MIRRVTQRSPMPLVVKRASFQPPTGLLARWPALAVAMRNYQERQALGFLDAVQAEIVNGLIPGAARRRLANRATDDGISPFDAQLLIACALREWKGEPSAKPRVANTQHQRVNPRTRFDTSTTPRIPARHWSIPLGIVTVAAVLDVAVLSWWLS
jgi:hypothetical protein